MMQKPRGLEVHEHSYVSGPNAHKSWLRTLTHSHADGSTPHEHEHTGPACYVIDKDAWAAATGLKGGGRKRYTKAPTGPQLAWVERPECERTFRVIICAPVPGQGAGPGLAPVARMVLGYGLIPIVSEG